MSQEPNPIFTMSIELGPVEDTPLSGLTPYLLRHVRMPQINEEDDARLREDIQRPGRVLDPLWILADGRVIDGRTRLRHAVALGFATVPTQTVLTPLSDVEIEFLMGRLALERRQLRQGQKQEIALQLFTLLSEMSAGTRRPGRPRKDKPRSGPSFEGVSRLVGLSKRSAARLKAVQKRGSPALVEATGKSLSTGAAHTALAPAVGDDPAQVIEALNTTIPRRIAELSQGFPSWPREDQDRWIALLGDFTNSLLEALDERFPKRGGAHR